MKLFLSMAILFLGLTLSAQQTIKSKNLKLKYTLPSDWTATEFGTKNWEEPGNNLCRCAGVLFSKPHKDGKMNVIVYPSSRGGLDSMKRNFVGTLHFEDVVKYDKIKNKAFSFERKKSNFTDIKTKAKSYEVFRYLAKIENDYYLIYAWQESMNALNSNNEKELYEMVNALEPI
jgi:hypothetical protein